MRTPPTKFLQRSFALVFFVSLLSAPIGQIALGQSSNSTPIEQSASGGLEAIPTAPKDEQGYYVKDAYNDVLDLGGNKQRIKTYSFPRPVYTDENGFLRAREAGWNLFDAEAGSKLKKPANGGYKYSSPNKVGDPVIIKNGALEFKKTGKKISAKSVNFTQETEDKNLEKVTTYKDLYPDIDVKFNDVKQYRYKSTIINKQPTNLDKSDSMIFWETYQLPKGTTVSSDSGPIGDKEVSIKNSAIHISLTDGNTLTIGSSIVFDATEKDSTLQDLSQLVRLDKKTNTLSIGVKLDATYLQDPSRVYPVTIDPVYYYCQGSNRTNCSITDLYLRYLTGHDTTRADLWVGYYNDNGTPATRHTVAKFNINYPANITSVQNANVYMTGHSTVGSGTYNGSIETRAYQIAQDWTTSNITYSNIRGTLNANGGLKNISYSPGTQFSWNVLNMVNSWRTTPSTNYGLLIEPTPRWLSGSIPAWQNRLYVFYSSRDTQNRGPYLSADIITNNQPDLTTNNSTIAAPASIYPGGVISTTINIRNIGGATAPSGQVRIYMKEASTPPQSSDYSLQNLVGLFNYSSILANGTASQQFIWNTPYNLASGNYYVYYYIDATNTASESDETNNRFFFSTQRVVTAGADLTRSSDSFSPLTVNPGGAINYSITVGNASSSQSSSGGGTVKVYFKSGSASYSDTYLVRSHAYPVRSPGQTTVINSSYTVPTTATAGTYSIYYWIDANNDTNETNENNNRFARSIAVQANSNDLQALNASYQSSGLQYPENRISTRVRLINTGAQAANNISYRIAMVDTSSGAAYLLGNLSSAYINLGANHDSYQNFSGTIPFNAAYYRNYVLRFELDHTNTFNDPNRGNNISTTSSGFRLEPTNYGGGGTQPPNTCNIRGLLDTDCDTYADLEEKTGGTNVNGSQTLNLYDTDYLQYLPKKTDREFSSYGADPVNLRTGAFEFTQTDFKLPGRGLSLNFERTYNSTVPDFINRLGFGWNYSYNTYYFQDPTTSNVLVNFGNRESALFTFNSGTGTFTPPLGIDSTLTGNSSIGFTYRTLEGIEYRFTRIISSTMGVLERAVDTNGNITQLIYTNVRDVPLLTTVRDPSGRDVVLTYGSSDDPIRWDKVTRIVETVNPTTAERRAVDYTYDSNGDLTRTSSTRAYQGGVENITRNFTYDGNHRMLTYTDPRGTILTNVYDSNGKVIRQFEFNPRVDSGTPAEGRRVYELDYIQGAYNPAPSAVKCTLVRNYRDDNNFYTDRECYNANDLVVLKEDGGNNRTAFGYNTEGMLISTTDPNGNLTTYGYDSRRRRVVETRPDAIDSQGSGNLRTRRLFNYENTFNRLTSESEVAENLSTSTVLLQRSTAYTINPANGNVTAITKSLTPTTNATENFGYDSYGNVTSHTDANGNVTNYTYDSNGNYQLTQTIQNVTNTYQYDIYGNATRHTSPRSNVTSFSYDTHGNLRSKTLPANGGTWTYEYDVENHLIRETDSLNRKTEFTYDRNIEASLLSKTKLGRDGAALPPSTPPSDYTYQITESFQYDFVGNKIRATSPRGTITTFVYNSANRLSSRSNPFNTTNYTYNPNGTVAEETNSAGQRSSFVYDARNNITSKRNYITPSTYVEMSFEYDGLERNIVKRDGRGNSMRTNFDLANRVTSTFDEENKETRFTYDANGNQLSVTLPNAIANSTLANVNGHTTTNEYDSLNRLTRTRNALNKITTTEYDQDSNATQLVNRMNANGTLNTHVTTLAYDELNRLTRETDAYGNYSEFTYNAVGNRLTARDKEGNISRFEYDSFNRLIREIDPANNVTHHILDQENNETKLVYSDATEVNRVFDSINRLTALTDSIAGRRSITYDAAGNILTETDKNSNVTTFTYDLLNRLASERNALNTTTTYTYDANGNRLSESTNGKVRTWTYSARNQISTMSEGAQTLMTYTYDANNNQSSYRNGTNELIQYTYDGLDRNVRKTLPNSTNIEYTYDNWNNSTSTVHPDITTTQTFDLLNRPTSETQVFTRLSGTTYTIGRQYDNNGELTRLTDAGGRVFNYAYNNRRLLNSVTYNGTALATYTYNAMQGQTNVTYGNGVTTALTYDQLNRATTIETKNSADTSLFKHSYSYDAESNRTQLVENDTRTTAYTYDAIHELTSVDYDNIPGATPDIRYTYDVWGNRTQYTAPHTSVSSSYASDSQRITSMNHNSGRLTVAMTHDTNGNLTREQYARLGTDIRDVNYSYNAEQRLTQISYASTRATFLPTLPPTVIGYEYDDNGNRIRKLKSGVATYSINNGIIVLNEADNAGVITKSIVQGLDQVAEIDATGTIKYMHQDILGSTIIVTDANENVVQRYEYAAFGETIGAQGSSNTNYQFTGQEFDPESGLIYMNARYYNPEMGRFLAQDPFFGRNGNILSRNPYIYVENNPLKYTDSTGQIIDIFADIFFGVIDVGQTVYGGSQYTYGYFTKNEDLKERGANNAAEGATSLVLDAGAALVPGATGAGVIYRVGKAADKVNDARKTVDKGKDAVKALNKTTDSIEGVYKITLENGDKYVGQSKNIYNRIKQHIGGKTPKFKPEKIKNIEITKIDGGKTTREVFEQQTIDKLGGIGNNKKLLNKVNPIGANRQHLFKPNNKSLNMIPFSLQLKNTNQVNSNSNKSTILKDNK